MLSCERAYVHLNRGNYAWVNIRILGSPTARRASSRSGGVRRDAHDELAEIASVEHSDEGFRCVFQAVYDVLTIANAAVGDAGTDFRAGNRRSTARQNRS